MRQSMGGLVGVKRYKRYGGVCVLVGLPDVKVGGVGEVEVKIYRLDFLA